MKKKKKVVSHYWAHFISSLSILNAMLELLLIETDFLNYGFSAHTLVLNPKTPIVKS